MNFTEQQLSDWRRYEAVRQSGICNMWFPQARQATGLDRKRHLFCLANYDALREACAAKPPTTKASEPQ